MELREEKKSAPSKVLLFGASWCGPCQIIKSQQKWAEESGWKFGKYAHIEIVDIDLEPERFDKYNKGDRSIPKSINLESGELITPGHMLDVLNLYTRK